MKHLKILLVALVFISCGDPSEDNDIYCNCVKTEYRTEWNETIISHVEINVLNVECQDEVEKQQTDVRRWYKIECN